VFWDLIWGVLVGMFVANLLTVDAITRSQLEGMEEDNPSDATDALHANLSPEEEALILRCGKALMLFRLRGPLSFGAAKGISARMGLIQSYRVLILDLTDVSRIGVTATLAIERMVEEARSAGRTLFIAGANHSLEQRLRQFGVEGVLRPSRLEALQEAAQLI
jgi:SulP family sulfate permease